MHSSLFTKMKRWRIVAADCEVVVEDLQKNNSTSYGAIIHEIIARSSAFDFVVLDMNLGAPTMKLTTFRGMHYLSVVAAVSG